MKTRSINFPIRHAKCAKPTLTKLRFKAQVSAAFASVSILIDGNLIDPEDPNLVPMPEISKDGPKASEGIEGVTVDENGLAVLGISNGVGKSFVVS
jgi:hypothetical protein